MAEVTRKCAYCEQRYDVSEFTRNGDTYRWCRFCSNRYHKIWAAFHSVGKIPPAKHQLHRAWKLWRQTPELDAMYLEPIERAAA